jgi:hypothetical protein
VLMLARWWKRVESVCWRELPDSLLSREDADASEVLHHNLTRVSHAHRANKVTKHVHQGVLFGDTVSARDVAILVCEPGLDAEPWCVSRGDREGLTREEPVLSRGPGG